MKIIFVIISNLLILSLFSCDDTITSADIDNLVMPDSNVSYSLHIAPVFEAKCVSCHNSANKQGGVDLSSWAAATSDYNIIFPGSDSTSILVWTIEGTYSFPLMPPNERLKQNHIEGIKTWIREGAQYN